MAKVWSLEPRDDRGRVHLVATVDVPFRGLLGRRRADVVIVDLDGARPDLEGTARGLWCCQWLDELRAVSKPETLVAVADGFRQAQPIADALEVAGWDWRGTLGGGRPGAVLLVGVGDRRCRLSPKSGDELPDRMPDPYAWFAERAPGTTLVDPFADAQRLDQASAAGFSVVGRSASASAWVKTLGDRYRVTSKDRPEIWQAAFLNHLRGGSSLRIAAELAGVDRSTVYKAIRRDASFAASVESIRWDA